MQLGPGWFRAPGVCVWRCKGGLPGREVGQVWNLPLWGLVRRPAHTGASSARTCDGHPWATAECVVCASPESPRCEFQMPASAAHVVGSARVSLAPGAWMWGPSGGRGPLRVGCVPTASLLSSGWRGKRHALSKSGCPSCRSSNSREWRASPHCPLVSKNSRDCLGRSGWGHR